MLIKLIVSLTVMTTCMYLLRGMWRVLVDIPDARQVWVPDVVDDLLSRMISAALILGSGLFLVAVAQAAG
ncbi:MAG: hypothetical protein JWQ33_789 [Ramlibacter sp.]|nr:hypothetical protein [Ramlibacter sp.]